MKPVAGVFHRATTGIAAPPPTPGGVPAPPFASFKSDLKKAGEKFLPQRHGSKA